MQENRPPFLQGGASLNFKDGVDLATGGVLTQKERRWSRFAFYNARGIVSPCHGDRVGFKEGMEDWGRMGTTEKILKKVSVEYCWLTWHLFPSFCPLPYIPRIRNASVLEDKELYFPDSLAAKALATIQVFLIGVICMRCGREAFYMSLWCLQASSCRCVYWW